MDDQSGKVFVDFYNLTFVKKIWLFHSIISTILFANVRWIVDTSASAKYLLSIRIQLKITLGAVVKN